MAEYIDKARVGRNERSELRRMIFRLIGGLRRVAPTHPCIIPPH